MRAHDWRNLIHYNGSLSAMMNHYSEVIRLRKEDRYTKRDVESLKDIF